MVAGLVRSGVGPFTGDGLDEALGLTVGLGAVGAGEAVFDAESLAGGGKEFGAIGGAAIGEKALDANTVGSVKGDGLAEGIESTGDLFVGKQAGESEAGVIVDGDVQGLDPGAWVAHGAIAGGAHARSCETAQLLDVEVEEFSRSVAFVADDGRLGRLERREAMEAVAAQHPREGGFGDRQNHDDLGIGATVAAQGEDAGFELWAGLAGLAQRSRRTILEARWKARRPGASQPAADSLFADAISRGRGASGKAKGGESKDHLGSRERGEFGISVHVVRAGGRWVECSSTTSLPNPCRADNVLKHDT